MKLTTNLMGIAAGVALLTGANAAVADGHLEEITVAYFLEWPTANQFAQENKLYEEVMGVKINWVSFDAGTAMSAAMASGDVHISYSQGMTPFLMAVAAGQDLQAIDIAVSYSDNDNCVVRSSLEIDKTNAGTELPGKQVGVALGTAAHSGFLAQMRHFGVDPDAMTVVDMAPVDSAAAFAAGELDMACGWSGPLQRMKEHGNVLIEGAEKEAVVGRMFDVVSIPASFGAENPELVAKFLKVNADMESRYRENPDAMFPTIAKAAGMDVEAVKTTAAAFGYPTAEEKLGDRWFGGGLAEYLSDVAKTAEEDGQYKSLDDYAPVVNGSFLEAASKM